MVQDAILADLVEPGDLLAMASIGADVVISWYTDNPETQEVRTKFERPTRFISMAAGPGTNYQQQVAGFGAVAIQNLIRQRLPDVVPLRVGLMGFSEGCQGVREWLKCGDGPRVDSVLAIDGIHAQWTKPRETFDTAFLLAWRALARSAVRQVGPLLVVTTSNVQPEFVDTTTTSNWLWEQATGSSEITYDQEIPGWMMGPVEPPYTNPAGSFGPGQASWKQTTYENYPLRAFRKMNGLWVINYWNLDATGVGDHRFQAARVSPLVMHHVLAERWNQQEPDQGVLLGTDKKPVFFDLGKLEVGRVTPLPPKDQTSGGLDQPSGGDDQPVVDDGPVVEGHDPSGGAGKAVASFLAGVALGAIGTFVATRPPSSGEPNT